MLNIPIVIAAFNREKPLKRLLISLSNAHYAMDVKLIISIDGGDNSMVVDVANQFEWPHGEKQVKVQSQNIGLRDHILQCGRLTNEYDGIILLEDDLYVSPYFYNYVIDSHNAYHCEEKITGVALYSQQYNETACLPFSPIEDGNDVFFMQVACSWGQSWLTHQWEAFEEWYDSNCNLKLSRDKHIPPDVRLWPDTSWKKYYLKYMLSNNKYFVYPRASLVTNFADPGVHHSGSNIFQAPLLCRGKEFSFPKFEESISKYDAYCEISAKSLSPIIMGLTGIGDFDVDLYGMKKKQEMSSKYVLTTQGLKQAIKCFGRNLKPHEMNIFNNIYGDEIFFGLKDNMLNQGDFLSYRGKLNQDYEKTHSYFYPITVWHYKPNASQIPSTIYEKIYNKIKQLVEVVRKL